MELHSIANISNRSKIVRKFNRVKKPEKVDEDEPVTRIPMMELKSSSRIEGDIIPSMTFPGKPPKPPRASGTPPPGRGNPPPGRGGPPPLKQQIKP